MVVEMPSFHLTSLHGKHQYNRLDESSIPLPATSFDYVPELDHGGRDTKFSFDVSTWNTSMQHTIGLTQIPESGK